MGWREGSFEGALRRGSCPWRGPCLPSRAEGLLAIVGGSGWGPGSPEAGPSLQLDQQKQERELALLRQQAELEVWETQKALGELLFQHRLEVSGPTLPGLPQACPLPTKGQHGPSCPAPAQGPSKGWVGRHWHSRGQAAGSRRCLCRGSGARLDSHTRIPAESRCRLLFPGDR